MSITVEVSYLMPPRRHINLSHPNTTNLKFLLVFLTPRTHDDVVTVFLPNIYHVGGIRASAAAGPWPRSVLTPAPSRSLHLMANY